MELLVAANREVERFASTVLLGYFPHGVESILSP